MSEVTIQARAYPLAAVINERSVAEMTSQRTIANAVLCLHYKYIHAGGRQQPRRVQA